MPEQQNPSLRVEQVPLDHLRTLAASGQLYAIADATDAPAVPKKVLEMGPARAVSLYRGTAEEEFWEIAPYLLHVDTSVLEWILSTLDLTRWGIFAVSEADLKALRTHFRHFLKVQSPGGEQWHFRLYDPRVLRRFLRACLEKEIRRVFGQVRVFGLIDPETAQVLMINERVAQAPVVGVSSEFHSDLYFVIRSEHLKAFQAQAEADFANRLVRYLRDKAVGDAPDLASEVLEERVKSGVARARRYGLARESKLAAFVALMFEFAPNLDEHPRLHRILTDPHIPGDEKIDALVENASEADWISVEQSSDPSAWKISRPRSGA